MIDLAIRGLTHPALSAGPEDGEGVVLLHGFPLTHEEWTAHLPALAAAGYHVVAPAQRGYASTNRPGEVEAYAMDEMVADVVGYFDALGWERAHLVGHDWGAAVAWHVAGRLPERLLSFASISVPHPLAHSQAIETDAEQARMSEYITLFRKPGVAEEALLANDAAWLRDFSRAAPDPDRYIATFSDPSTLTATLNWYRTMRRRDGEITGRIKVPTLYIWGEEDHTIGRVAAENTASFVDGPYTFAPLAGVSHWATEQVPDTITALLLEHLAKYSAR